MIKVDLPLINQDDFNVVEKIIGGERCYLIHPKKQFYQWTKQNLILRSSIWNSEGYPVSLSFKKFFNWGERDELSYTPFSVTANGGINVFDKLDGSTLIISKYKGELIVRTRGTFDATQLAFGHEIELLKLKYPQAFTAFWKDDTAPMSLIFEWVSPSNQIVMKHEEADMYLLAVVNHEDYNLLHQSVVDEVAKVYGFKRPVRFHYESIKEMVEAVPVKRDVEGHCVYCNHDRDIRKIKTEWYLKMHHALTEEFSSFERMVEFYFTNGMPTTYSEFFDLVTRIRDFEIATHLRGDISRITDAMKEVRLIHSKYVEFANKLKAANISRKEVAEKVFATHGKTNRANMIFQLYDGKELDADSWKKLFFQVIKK